MKDLTVYERFVLIVNTNSLAKAKKLAGDNKLLNDVIIYLKEVYLFY